MNIGLNMSNCKKQSEVLAVFFSIPAINSIIISFFPQLSGYLMTIMYFIVGTLLILFSFSNANSVKNSLILYLYGVAILGIYIITYIFGTKSSTSFINLCVYVLIPILCCSKMKIDKDVFIRSGTVISAVGVFFSANIFKLTIHGSIEMGMAYAFLTPVVFSIVYFMGTVEKKWYCTIAACLDLGYMIEITLYGSRGAVLSFLIAVILFLIMQKRKGKIVFSVIKTAFIVILMILFVIYFWDILSSVNTIIKSWGMDLSFIDKMFILKTQNDISNGRSEIIALAWKQICTNPLFGRGISSFDYYNPGESYPHNFIIQMLYDIGFVGSAFLLIPICIGIIKWIRMYKYENYELIAFLFAASVPGAMFSGDLWKKPILWLLFAIMLRYCFKINDKKWSVEK